MLCVEDSGKQDKISNLVIWTIENPPEGVMPLSLLFIY